MKEHCVDFKIHDNFHQHWTTGGVGGVWHRGTQAKDSSPYTPCQARGSILVKAHVLSGNDAVSEAGTAPAAPTCTNEGGVMIPTASIQPITPELLVCCLGGETRKCKCKANGIKYAFTSVTKEEIYQYMWQQMMKICW